MLRLALILLLIAGYDTADAQQILGLLPGAPAAARGIKNSVCLELFQSVPKAAEVQSYRVLNRAGQIDPTKGGARFHSTGSFQIASATGHAASSAPVYIGNASGSRIDPRKWVFINKQMEDFRTLSLYYRSRYSADAYARWFQAGQTLIQQRIWAYDALSYLGRLPAAGAPPEAFEAAVKRFRADYRLGPALRNSEVHGMLSQYAQLIHGLRGRLRPAYCRVAFSEAGDHGVFRITRSRRSGTAAAGKEALRIEDLAELASSVCINFSDDGIALSVSMSIDGAGLPPMEIEIASDEGLSLSVRTSSAGKLSHELVLKPAAGTAGPDSCELKTTAAVCFPPDGSIGFEACGRSVSFAPDGISFAF